MLPERLLEVSFDPRARASLGSELLKQGSQKHRLLAHSKRVSSWVKVVF